MHPSVPAAKPKDTPAPFLAPGDTRHGTRYAYVNLRCRCALCRAENAAYAAARRQRYAELDADDPRHGKTSTYDNWGCRCAPCKAAKRDANAAAYRVHRGA